MKKHYYTKDIIDICDKKHLTIEEIYIELKKTFPNAGKSSVYRNVEELAIKGKLKKITGIGKKSYFEKNIGTHIHLVDNKTGKITDIETDLSLPKLPSNFNVSNVDMKIFGDFY